MGFAFVRMYQFRAEMRVLKGESSRDELGEQLEVEGP